MSLHSPPSENKITYENTVCDHTPLKTEDVCVWSTVVEDHLENIGNALLLSGSLL